MMRIHCNGSQLNWQTCTFMEKKIFIRKETGSVRDGASLSHPAETLVISP